MGTRKPRFRVLAVGVGLGLMFLVAACGGSNSEASATASEEAAIAASPAPTRTEPLPDMFNNLHTDLTSGVPEATATATASANSGRSAGSIIPANFPVPPGATSTVSVDKATDAQLNITGVTPAAAVTFYRQALPTVGYTFFQQSIASDKTKLTYTGHDQSVEVLAGTGVQIVFAQCTTAIAGNAAPTKRSDRVACA